MPGKNGQRTNPLSQPALGKHATLLVAAPVSEALLLRLTPPYQLLMTQDRISHGPGVYWSHGAHFAQVKPRRPYFPENSSEPPYLSKFRRSQVYAEPSSEHL